MGRLPWSQGRYGPHVQRTVSVPYVGNRANVGSQVNIGAASSGKSSVGALTFSHTIPPFGNVLLLVGVGSFTGAGDVTSVTYNGVACTKLDEQAGPNTEVAEIWYLVNPARGVNDVVVTGPTTDISAGAVSLWGVHQTAPLGAAVKGTGDGTGKTLDVATVQGDLVFFTIAGFDDGNAPVQTGTGASGTDEMYDQTDSNGTWVWGGTKPGTGTITIGCTVDALLPDGSCAAVAVNVKHA